MNLYGYIKKYKNFDFFESEMNEVDILLFSQLSYIVFDTIDFSNLKKYSLLEIHELVDREKARKYVLPQRTALRLLDMIYNTKRYSKILLFNYEYVVDKDMQFGALTIELPDGKIVVSFEGTDDTLVGWKEDMILSYKYPTESQKKAGEYLNALLSLTTCDTYVCGHSKGGNLALVASMRTGIFKRNKITQIYSFDGPGIRETEFNSHSYRRVRNRLKNIIPTQSLIGVLFEQEHVDVVQSSAKGIMQHDVTSWLIEEDRLARTDQSRISQELDEVITRWMQKYNCEERENIITTIFALFERAGLKKTSDFTDNKLKSIIELVKATKFLDEETKAIVLNCLKVLVGDIGTVIWNEELHKIKHKFGKIKLLSLKKQNKK